VSKCALLLINRKSRSGAGDVDTVVSRLRAQGIQVLQPRLERPDQIPALIQHHRQDVNCVVIGGGDGSMNAAAPALVETGLPLGVLPMGTANDLARTLSIPTDLEQAIDVIGNGVLHRIDLGRVNGHYFFNVANIGLGVHVTHHLSFDMKQRWGVLCYAQGLLKALQSFRPFHADIVCDGRRKRVKSIQIAVGNGRHYGGGMTVAAQASIDDHKFFLYSIEPAEWWQMLRFVPALRSGRFRQDQPVDIDQGRHIEIHTRRDMDITADGEIISRTPARFDLVAGAVRVFVPRVYFEDKEEMLHAAQE